jgi:hypothetical protein
MAEELKWSFHPVHDKACYPIKVVVFGTGSVRERVV